MEQWVLVVIVAIIGALAYVIINNWFGDQITAAKPAILDSPSGGT
jgi:hypothetical protein